MQNTKTWLLLNDESFKKEFLADLEAGMPTIVLLEKYRLSYHRYRVLVLEWCGRPLSACRMANKQNKIEEK